MIRGYAAVGLDNPKTPINIGHVLRAAGCFNASMVAIGGVRPTRVRLSGAVTDTQKLIDIYQCCGMRIYTI